MDAIQICLLVAMIILYIALLVDIVIKQKKDKEKYKEKNIRVFLIATALMIIEIYLAVRSTSPVGSM